jgi:DNA-binding beta-propeller fold protein YncE
MLRIRLLIIPACLLLVSFSLGAARANADCGQSWGSVGGAAVTTDQTDNESIAINASGTPYVAYADESNDGDEPVVQEYNGSNWVEIGGAPVTTDFTEGLRLSISPSGTPYVVYDDVDNDFQSIVQEYNGSSWVSLGVAPTSTGPLVFDASDTPYMASVNSISQDDNEPVVEEYTSSTWVEVGGAPVTTDNEQGESLVISASGTPYLAYTDQTNNNVVVQEFNGTSWVEVGGAPVGSGTMENIFLAISPSGSPYLIYTAVLGKGATQTFVEEFNGTSWVEVGSAPFTTDGIGSASLAFDPSGNLYLAYRDGSHDGELVVQEYNGSAWAEVGGAPVTTDDALYDSLAIDPSGTPYVAYGDYSNNREAVVQAYGTPSDASEVFNAQSALTAAAPLVPVQGVDTNVVPVAQAIANAASCGVTISSTVNSANSAVASDGTITYGTSTVTGNVTFTLFKNAALSTSTVGVDVEQSGYLASGLLGHIDASGNPVYTTGGSNNDSGVTNAQGFFDPSYVALDSVNHRLFVSDGLVNNRILVFPLNAQNGIASTTAAYVLGQATFASTTAATTQNGLYSSEGLAYDPVANRLFVADSENSRVLVFDVVPSDISDDENAEAVLGQVNYVSSSSVVSQSSLAYPKVVAYDPVSSRLFVIDNGNRVLVFDASTSTLASTPTGEGAEAVIGQTDYVSSSTATTQNDFVAPQDLTYDPTSGRLFVADSYNNRVLVFDASTSTLASTPTGEGAEAVIGQTDYVSSSTATTQNGLDNPEGLAYDPITSRLFVSDTDNDRVLVFDASTSTLANTPTGEDAENVLSQNNFTSSDCGGACHPTRSNIGSPHGLAYDPANDVLFTTGGYSRVMQFSFITITDPILPSGTVGTAYSDTLNVTSTQGTATVSLYGGSLPAGLSLNSSTGVISGTPTTAGTYNFTLEAEDNFSTGPFIDLVSYSLVIAAAPIPPTPTPSPSVSVGVAGGSGGGGGYNYYPPTIPITPSSTASSSASVPAPTSTIASGASSLASLVAELRSLAIELLTSFNNGRSLTIGSQGTDVWALQVFLELDGSGPASMKLASIGPTGYFGSATQAALAEFQKSIGIIPASGYFGPITRAYVNNLAL